MHGWKKYEREGFRTRDAHLIQHFAKNENVRRIIVVDRPMILAEIILKRKRWRVKNGKTMKRTPSASLTKISEKIFVLDIFSQELIKPLILKRD